MVGKGWGLERGKERKERVRNDPQNRVLFLSTECMHFWVKRVSQMQNANEWGKALIKTQYYKISEHQVESKILKIL